jgi:hypothetical protein
VPYADIDQLRDHIGGRAARVAGQECNRMQKAEGFRGERDRSAIEVG